MIGIAPSTEQGQARHHGRTPGGGSAIVNFAIEAPTSDLRGVCGQPRNDFASTRNADDN